MTENHDTVAPVEPKRLGLLAPFAGPDALVAAAEKITKDGYRRVEAYSPFAIIGIDEALKSKGTILPWIVAALGALGCLMALAMQVYTNGVEGAWWLSGYHFQISAKPGLTESGYVPSLPAFIPVTFEVIVLLSAFGAFFGMLILNKLPRLSNPLFRSERFADVTTDGFFLYVEAGDPKYAETETEAYLSSIGATGVEVIEEPVSGHAVPGMLYLVGAAVGCVALLPPLYLWTTSSTTTSLPRISFFKDMESQAKYKAQTLSTLFADSRAARKPIPGTVARGSGKDDLPLYYGVNPEDRLASLGEGSDFRFASYDGGRTPARLVAQAEGGEPADEESDAEADAESTDEPATDGEPTADTPPEEEEKNWVTEFPESLTLDQAFMDRGEERYNIHCAACHGLAGNGDGLVSQRALSLQQGAWVQPTSFHVEAVTTQPVGRIFDTISNGRRKMPGYRELITPTDRWAIVLYVQALQRSQNASVDDLPADKRRELTDRN